MMVLDRWVLGLVSAVLLVVVPSTSWPLEEASFLVDGGRSEHPSEIVNHQSRGPPDGPDRFQPRREQGYPPGDDTPFQKMELLKK